MANEVELIIMLLLSVIFLLVWLTHSERDYMKALYGVIGGLGFVTMGVMYVASGTTFASIGLFLSGLGIVMWFIVFWELLTLNRERKASFDLP